MLSLMINVGCIRGEPKRVYTKKKNCELSNFDLLVKRDDNSNKWDVFRFTAWGAKAKYINDYLHNGYLVSVVSRPKRVKFVKKDGTKVELIQNVVISINYICQKNKILINQFGGIDFPALQDIEYDLF